MQKRVSSYAKEHTNVLGQLAAVKMARVDVDAGRTQQALDGLKAAIGNGDEILDDVIRLRVARLATELGKYDEAKAALQNVKEEAFAKAVAEAQGDALLASGDRKGALEQYKKALDLSADQAQEKVLQMKHDALLETAGVALLNLGAPAQEAPKAVEANAEATATTSKVAQEANNAEAATKSETQAK